MNNQAKHDEWKQHVHTAALHEERIQARGVFSQLAIEKQGVYKDVLDFEMEVCGTADEPEIIKFR